MESMFGITIIFITTSFIFCLACSLIHSQLCVHNYCMNTA